MMYAKTGWWRRTGRGRRATTVLELALVLPIVLVFILGSIDFAEVMYAYGTVSEAARTGARYAMVHGAMASSPVGPAANDATVESVVRSNALALNPSALTVTSSWGAGDNNVTSPVTVTATYTCNFSVGKLVGLGTINVSGSTTMMIAH